MSSILYSNRTCPTALFSVKVCGEDTRRNGTGAGGAATLRRGDNFQPTEALWSGCEWIKRRYIGTWRCGTYGGEDSKSHGTPYHCDKLFR